MSVPAVQVRRFGPRRVPSLTAGRSRLSRPIVATTLAASWVTLLISCVAFAPGGDAAGEAVVAQRLLGAFVVASAASLALGRWLARHVTAPLASLRCVVEAVCERHLDAAMLAGGIRLPDVTGRPDEIGQLAAGLQRLVAALSDRIAASEELAADVAHEIRNPLASLRSAAEALRLAGEDQRARLVDVITRDVARLDRLVGEVSSASKLDAELVREQAVEFDLVATMRILLAHLADRATATGIEMLTDLPAGPLRVVGIESRLAQVIVNLVENAVSLCDDGDGIRIWARLRDDRVLIVVEDTGPGIPEGNAEKIFRRFYSHRPADQFGANSGLGLAISRQIVEAHDGVIWAENIRPTESDLLSEPLGARFIVVLPR